MLYFCFAFIPMFLAYSATLIDPNMVAGLIDTDPQLILPSLIMQHVPVFAQVMFFGALLSAIKSCASATLLAPSVTFTENILRGAFKHWTDRQFLFAMRAVVLCFTAMVTVFALNTDASIYKMVENAYKVTLVAAIVPAHLRPVLAPRRPASARRCAIVLGLATWINLEIVSPDGLVPPQLAGLAHEPRRHARRVAGFLRRRAEAAAHQLVRAALRVLNTASQTPPLPGADLRATRANRIFCTDEKHLCADGFSSAPNRPPAICVGIEDSQQRAARLFLCWTGHFLFGRPCRCSKSATLPAASAR